MPYLSGNSHRPQATKKGVFCSVQLEVTMSDNQDSITIIRSEHNRDNPYVIMDKRIFENKAMSWKAKGMLGYFLSRPDNWKIILADLVKRSTDGMHAIRSTLHELEECGYLKQERRHSKETGQFEWLYVVYESPSPSIGFPSMVNPSMDNHTLLNNDCTNNESKDIIGDSKNESPTPPRTQAKQDGLGIVLEDQDTTETTMPEDSILFKAINDDRRANKQRAIRIKFDTLQQKEKWRGAMMTAQRIFNGAHEETLTAWIKLAMEKGIRNKSGIIAYVAKCAANQADRQETPLRVY